jgi:hypothetical protein
LNCIITQPIKIGNIREQAGLYHLLSERYSTVTEDMRLFTLFITIGVAASQLVGTVGPSTPLKDKTIECNVLKYGAVANNSTDISSAIEKAFTECVLRSPRSRLIIPEGDYLLSKSVVLSNGTNWAFQLDGLITAAYDGDWAVDRNLTLQGFAGSDLINSTINGEGDGKFLLDVLVIINGKFQRAQTTQTALLIKLSFICSR